MFAVGHDSVESPTGSASLGTVLTEYSVKRGYAFLGI
ncbi:hypothetical protein ZOD2009_06102 [Haladaptatus paucihalophilus DX253]|uniref:Uncharacterized protein n=1 Tax=Haladaptatus paucihalophilus DX253 TaxID=797209 RepID=E7QR00_HALPU|nr:hypothetical protein ZOD2009_06102 [Haladaptatus paucihalophilus DX253]